MKSIHIRDVDPATLESLERLARSHRRSLQGELHAILDRAARSAPPAQQEPLAWVTVETGSAAGTFSRREIYDDDGR